MAKDEKATLYAVLFFAIGGALGGLFSGSIGGIVAGAIGSAISSFIAAGILHLLAKLFGGKSGFMGFYRALGIGSVVAWLNAIPFLGIVSMIWNIVVNINIVKNVHGLSTGKSVIVVLIPMIILFILVMIGVLLFMSTIMTLAGTTGMNLEAFQGDFVY